MSLKKGKLETIWKVMGINKKGRPEKQRLDENDMVTVSLCVDYVGDGVKWRLLKLMVDPK